MAATVKGANTCTVTKSRYEPNWSRFPPHVPTYPNPPALLRRTEADKYTNPGDTFRTYYKESRPWNVEYPEWREEFFRLDPRAPVERKIDYKLGPNAPAYKPSIEPPLPKWNRQGLPPTEAKRAFGMKRMSETYGGKNLYEFSNAMTSTQYKKPIPNVYGPLLRDEVYGVRHQHNYHGFMPFDDYYF